MKYQGQEQFTEVQAAIAEIKAMSDKAKGRKPTDGLFDAQSEFMFGKHVPSLSEMSAAGIHFPTLDERIAEKNALAASQVPDEEELNGEAQFRRDHAL